MASYGTFAGQQGLRRVRLDPRALEAGTGQANALSSMAFERMYNAANQGWTGLNTAASVAAAGWKTSRAAYENFWKARAEEEVKRARSGATAKPGSFRYPVGQLKNHEHYVDSSFTTAGVTGTSLVLIGTGCGPTTRTGRKITIREIHYRITITQNGQTDHSDADNLYRVMLIQDKQANGAQVSNTVGILDDPVPDSFLNLSNRNRYVVLYNQMGTIHSAAGGGGWNGSSVALQGMDASKFSKKSLKVEIPILYSEEDSPGTTLITNVLGTNLFWVCLAKHQSARYRIRTRLRFTDA